MSSFDDAIQEVFGVQTCPRFAMYTKKGDRAVYELVKRAKLYNQSWPELYAEMREVAELNEDLAEMMDTEVREAVYSYMGYHSGFYI